MTDTCTKIEEVIIQSICQRLHISLFTSAGKPIELPDDRAHRWVFPRTHVQPLTFLTELALQSFDFLRCTGDADSLSYSSLYKVTLKSGEVWAVDPTGAQHGYPNPLQPWHDFVQKRSGTIDVEWDIGNFRVVIFNSYGNFPDKVMLARSKERLELAAALDATTPALTKPGVELKSTLDGTDAAFERARAELLDLLDTKMRRLMVYLYSREEVLRRVVEVECILSERAVRANGENDPSDPESEDRMEELVRGMVSTGVTGSGSGASNNGLARRRGGETKDEDPEERRRNSD